MRSKIQYLGHSFHVNLARRADSDYISDLVIFTIKRVFTTRNEKKWPNRYIFGNSSSSLFEWATYRWNALNIEFDRIHPNYDVMKVLKKRSWPFAILPREFDWTFVQQLRSRVPQVIQSNLLEQIVLYIYELVDCKEVHFHPTWNVYYQMLQFDPLFVAFAYSALFQYSICHQNLETELFSQQIMVSFPFRPEDFTLKIRTSRQKNSPSNVLRIRVFSLSHSDSRVSQWRFVTSSNVFCFCSAITKITFQHLKSHEIHYYSLIGSRRWNWKF